MKALIYCITSTLILIQWTQPVPAPLDELNINIRIDDGPDQSARQRHPSTGQLQPPSRQPLQASDYGGYKKDGGNKKYRFKEKYASNKYRRNKYRRNKYSKKGQSQLPQRQPPPGQLQLSQEQTSSGPPCRKPRPFIGNQDQDIGDGKLYFGIFVQNYGTSGTINVNICKKENNNGQYDCSHPGGTYTIFGGSNQRPAPPSTLPSKIDVTENAKKAGITKVNDVRFEVISILDTDGNKIEKEVFQPIRVYRPGGSGGRTDYYTIFFNTSVIQPPAITINNGTTFMIESPHEQIYQVNTDDDYNNCNTDRFICLPSHFFMTKSNVLYYDLNFGTHNEEKTNGSYYFFDRDGVPKSCAGGAASNGSSVKLIIE